MSSNDDQFSDDEYGGYYSDDFDVEPDDFDFDYFERNEENEDDDEFVRLLQSELDRLIDLLISIEYEKMRNRKPTKKTQICRYFLMGNCKHENEEDCPYIHKKSVEITAQKEPCKFFKLGTCKFGNFCRNSHEQPGTDTTCGICLESITNRFGILENCEHTFCLSCIMSWRKQNFENSKKCPLCREKSYFVLPSNTNVKGNEKFEMIEMYKEKSKEIPCKFEKLCGSCQFGEHCFFKHQK